MPRIRLFAVIATAAALVAPAASPATPPAPLATAQAQYQSVSTQVKTRSTEIQQRNALIASIKANHNPFVVAVAPAQIHALDAANQQDQLKTQGLMKQMNDLMAMITGNIR